MSALAMPDGTDECRMIMSELRSIRDGQTAHGLKIAGIETTLASQDKKLENIDATVSGIVVDRAKESGQLSGATWALAKVGTVCVALLSVAGWLLVNGVPAWVREVFNIQHLGR